MRRALISRFVLALLFMSSVTIAGRAQSWWNPDYTKRLPVTIANTGASATPAPTSAEITLSPIPTELRSDWTDLRVLYWNGTAWTDLDRQVLLDRVANPNATPPVEAAVRVVFRLQAPIAAGASSTGEYFLYYGNPSPTRPKTDVYNIYDHVVDFEGAENVVGQPAPEWEPAEPSTTFNVIEIGGKKHGLLKGTVSHPRAIVKKGSMPDFLNAEAYSRVMPFGGGEREIVTMLRAVNDPTKYSTLTDPERAHYGGYGFVMAGFGDQDGMVSLINPNEPPYNRGPADFGGLVEKGAEAFRKENVIFRVEDQLLSGKRWHDREAQPPWTKEDVDRAAANPVHGEADPLYDQSGGTGIASYTQQVAVEFIALRELRALTTTPGAVESAPAGGPFIQGTVTSSLGNTPLADAEVTISNGTTTTIYTDALGRFKITLPAGTYNVSAASYAHTTGNVTGVAPSASGATDFTLAYVGVSVTGTVRDKWTGEPVSGARVVLLSADHYNLQTVTSNSDGQFALSAPVGGSYEVGVVNSDGRGGRVPFTGTGGQPVTVNVPVAPLANGDVEIPNEINLYPMGWSNAEFGTPSPEAYIYTRERNHTTGGFWSIAIRKSGGTNSWDPPNAYSVPVMADRFDVTISLWVYMETAGQEAALRLRQSWPTPGALTGGRIRAIAGGDPDPANENKGGLVNGKVPVGQWYELRSSVPAGTALDNGVAGINAYAINTPAGGTIWFDDFTITQTPKNMIIGQVVDENNNPVPGAFAGRLTDAGGGLPPVLMDNVSPTDESGKFFIYTVDATPINLTAIRRVPATNPAALPDFGYVGESKAATPVAYDPNNTTPTVTIKVTRATNVADGTSAQAFTLDSNQAIVTREDTPAEEALDNDLTSRWSAGGNQNIPGLPKWLDYDLDLGAAKSIDQIDIAWETAIPNVLRIWVTNTPLDPNAEPSPSDLIYDSTTNASRGIAGYGAPWNLPNFPRYQVFRLPAPKTARYIRLEPDLAGDGHYSIWELRVLSLAEPLPPSLTIEDMQTALEIAGGFSPATPSDVTLYDLNADGKVDILDVVLISAEVRNG